MITTAVVVVSRNVVDVVDVVDVVEVLVDVDVVVDVAVVVVVGVDPVLSFDVNGAATMESPRMAVTTPIGICANSGSPRNLAHNPASAVFNKLTLASPGPCRPRGVTRT